jgi:membrane protein
VVQILSQVGIARYNAIYSTFAALPIFLIWVQMSWVTVLLGAEVCFAHQSAASYYPDGPAAGSLRERERIALRALARVAARSLRGEPACTAPELARTLGVSLRPLELVLGELVHGGLLAVARGNGADTYLLARDMDRIQVKTVLDLFRGPLERAGAESGADAEVAACLVGLDEALGESRHNLPLRALAEHEPGARAAGLPSEREGAGRG